MTNTTRTLDLDDCREFKIFKDKIEKIRDVRITSTRITNQGWKIYLDYDEKLVALLNRVTGTVWGRRETFSRLEGDLILTIQQCADKSLLSLEFRIYRDFNTNDVSLSLIRLTDRLDAAVDRLDTLDRSPYLPSARRTADFHGLSEEPSEDNTLIRSQMLTKIDHYLYRKQVQHLAISTSLTTRGSHLKHLLAIDGITTEYFFDLAKTKSGYRGKSTRRDRASEVYIVNWLSANSPSNVDSVEDVYTAFVVQLRYNGYRDILDDLTDQGSIEDKVACLKEMLIRSDYPWSWNLTMSKDQHDWVSARRIAKLTPLNVAITAGILDAFYKPSDWHIDPDTITENRS